MTFSTDGSNVLIIHWFSQSHIQGFPSRFR